MFKYRTCKHDITIEKVEIIRESDQSVWLKKNNRAERKITDYTIYHESFESAKTHLISKRNELIHYHESAIEKAKEEIKKINLLEEK